MKSHQLWRVGADISCILLVVPLIIKCPCFWQRTEVQSLKNRQIFKIIFWCSEENITFHSIWLLDNCINTGFLRLYIIYILYPLFSFFLWKGMKIYLLVIHLMYWIYIKCLSFQFKFCILSNHFCACKHVSVINVSALKAANAYNCMHFNYMKFPISFFLYYIQAINISLVVPGSILIV